MDVPEYLWRQGITDRTAPCELTTVTGRSTNRVRCIQHPLGAATRDLPGPTGVSAMSTRNKLCSQQPSSSSETTIPSQHCLFIPFIHTIYISCKGSLSASVYRSCEAIREFFFVVGREHPSSSSGRMAESTLKGDRVLVYSSWTRSMGWMSRSAASVGTLRIRRVLV